MRFTDMKRRFDIFIFIRQILWGATFLFAGYTFIVVRINDRHKSDLDIVLNRQPNVRTYLFNLIDTDSATIKISDKQMEELQKRRKHRIKKFCDREVQEELAEQPSTIWSAILDSRHRMLYCSVRRCATTAWKQYLLYINNRLIDPSVSLSTHQFYDDVVIKRLFVDKVKQWSEFKKVTSFLFVRDPWIRLVSAYISKVKESNYAFKQRRPCSWVKSPTNETKAAMTFKDFVTCIIVRAAKDGPQSLDEHWRPQYLFCNVCHIQYTHIGHMETLGADFDYIMKLAGKNKTDAGLSSHSSRSLSEAPLSVAKEYYQSITEGLIIKLQRLYRFDIHMHGYDDLPPGW